MNCLEIQLAQKPLKERLIVLQRFSLEVISVRQVEEEINELNFVRIIMMYY